MSTQISAAARRTPTRIAVVLSGGGLRGAAHIGVLQQLVAHNISIDAIVGASAGAVVAAYYAAVGLSLDELESDARLFRGCHLLAHSLNLRSRRRFDRIFGPLSGLIPTRLEQLDAASFERLHHGIRALGIVCHDAVAHRPRYFSSAEHWGAPLSDVVRASASLPGLFPSIRVRCENEAFQLSDGGISDCLPIDFAQQPPLSATHIIVSDCRWLRRRELESTDNVVHIRPPLVTTGPLWSPSSTLVAAVRQGATAVTEETVQRIRHWRSDLNDH
jgi:predicted acylesterase/phospholipase RssA